MLFSSKYDLMVAKAAPFERAAGRVGLDEEPQQHLGAAKTLQRKSSAVVRGEREIRRRLSDFDHFNRPGSIRFDVSIQHARSCASARRAGRIAGRECERAFEFVDRPFHHPLGGVDSTQVHERDSAADRSAAPSWLSRATGSPRRARPWRSDRRRCRCTDCRTSGSTSMARRHSAIASSIRPIPSNAHPRNVYASAVGKTLDRLGVELDRAIEIVVHVKAHRIVP